MKISFKVKEWLPVVILGIIYTGINSLQVIIQWLKNPPGAFFVGIAHYYADFFLYVAQMRQGAAGSLWYVHRFTDEVVPPTWIYWFNNLIGFLGHLTGLNVFVSYNFSLLFLVFILILLIYYLFKLIYPTDKLLRWISFLLFLFASPLVDTTALLQSGVIKLPDYLWFSPMLALNRFGGVPHQVWQTLLLITEAFLFTKFLVLMTKLAAVSQQNFVRLRSGAGKLPLKTDLNFRWRSAASLVGLIGVTILASTANPVTMLVFVIAAGILSLGEFIKHKSWQLLIPIIVASAVSLPSAYLTNRAFDTSIVFVVGKAWELNQYVDTGFGHFLLSLGSLTLFIPLGLIFGKNHRPLTTLLILYSFLALAFFFSPMPKFLGTTAVRFLSPFGFSGLVILAVEGMRAIAAVLTKIKIKPKVTLFFLTALVLLLSLPGFVLQVDNRISPAKNPFLLLDTQYNHIPPQIITALQWLSGQSDNPVRPVVLVDTNFRIEILVPAFANKTVYSGHPVHTLDPDAKEVLRNTFFNTNITADQAKAFLTAHRIGFVISKGGGQPHFAAFPFIKKVFENTGIAIFKVNL